MVVEKQRPGATPVSVVQRVVMGLNQPPAIFKLFTASTSQGCLHTTHTKIDGSRLPIPDAMEPSRAGER